MSEPYEITNAADRACGLRRYTDGTGREWIEPRTGPASHVRRPYPSLPDGFREITLRAFTDGNTVVIPEQEELSLPDDPGEADPDGHNCDANGCGWEHIIATFRIG
jgi:hypothetical protein